MNLRGKQKRFLRSKAHHLQPIFQIGKGGINEHMLIQVNEALEKRELIKISLLQNTDELTDDAALTIANVTKATVVQTIGHVIVLFKPSSKEKYQHLSKEVRDI